MKTVLRVGVVLLVLVVIGGAVFYLHPLWVTDQQLRLKLWSEGFRSHYVDLPSGHIHYYEIGEGAPLLLVHGLGARAEDWSNLIPKLVAAGFHVYAPDLLGYGRSAKPDVDYSIGLEERVTLEFMDAMKLQRPDVGGWSMGGWIAMQLALDHPERVDKLVIYDSAGVRFVPDFDVNFFTPGDAAGVRKLQETLFVHVRTIPPFVMTHVLQVIAQNKRIIGNSMADMMSGRELLDARLSGMSRPMLIVWGEQDKLLPLATVGETIHRLVPGSVLETVPGCGHMAPAECPEPVAADTVRFLKQ